MESKTSLEKVVKLFAQKPGLTLREAGEILGVSGPCVHRYKRKAEKLGLLELSRNWRGTKVLVTDEEIDSRLRSGM